MGKKEDEFLKKLLLTFQVEAEEHVRTLSSGLVEMERAPDDDRRSALTEILFREAHSLKGAARAVNLGGIETVCQSLESVFSAWKRGEVTPSPALFDLLHQAVDRLPDLLGSPKASPAPAESSQLRSLLHRLQETAKAEPPQPDAKPATRAESPAEAAEEGVVTSSEVTAPGPAEAAEQTIVVAGHQSFAARPQEPSGGLRPSARVESQARVVTQPRRLTTHTEEPVAAPGPHCVVESQAKGQIRTEEQAAGPTDTPGARSPVADTRPVSGDTVRISAARLDALLHQVEELLSVRLSAGQRALEVRTIADDLAVWERQWAKVRPDLRAIQQSLERDGTGGDHEALGRLVGFAEEIHGFLASLGVRMDASAAAAERDHHALGGMVEALLSDMKQVLMLPFSSLLEIVPKLVRDLSRDRGKDVDVVMHGSEIEIDRRILEELKDPVIHLIRNCVDHGIELPEDRVRKQKPGRGTITIAVSQRDGGKVEMSITDDGRGIDAADVREAAAKSGAVPREDAERLTDEQAVSLIFRSGVSTSPIITDLSGRGLGLAIVQEKVEKLGGVVCVEAVPDVGTTFRITLPLTIATFRGVLVRVNNHFFVIPTASVERVMGIQGEEIKTVENREAIELSGQAVALVRLGDVLELSMAGGEDGYGDMVHVVVLALAEKHIAFRVDEIINEQDVLVKPLGKQLSRVRNVSGATVLGTGKVVPILNVSDVMRSAVKAGSAGSTQQALSMEGEETERKSVIVVEDSITARTLLKNILESAGYDVSTAVDGVDGLTQLRTGHFSLVVSDVDMPRMNGFDLTASIRADKRLSELPVVLVTSLSSREDRERGIDVGANAYIVKSGFDQSNLLEVVSGLI